MILLMKMLLIASLSILIIVFLWCFINSLNKEDTCIYVIYLFHFYCKYDKNVRIVLEYYNFAIFFIARYFYRSLKLSKLLGEKFAKKYGRYARESRFYLSAH